MTTATEKTNHIDQTRRHCAAILDFLDQYPDTKGDYTGLFNILGVNQITDADFTGVHAGLTEAQYDAAFIALDTFLVGMQNITNFAAHRNTLRAFARR